MKSQPANRAETVQGRKITSRQTMEEVDALLRREPYGLDAAEKKPLFLAAMKEAMQHHVCGSDFFRAYCAAQDVDIEKCASIEELPWLPIGVFKRQVLLSVPRDEIVNVVTSSSTTGNKPGQVFLDRVTGTRQTAALAQIMQSFLGKERLEFIVFDARETAESHSGELSSRGTAIRGFLPFAKRVHFVLDRNLKPDERAASAAARAVAADTPVCFFGFTWLVHSVLENAPTGFVDALKNIAGGDRVALHMGGWKKLHDQGVSRDAFNGRIEEALGVPRRKVIDVYGMTEQLGTVYPDCGAGNKHAPLYADVLVRKIEDQSLCENGETGFLQLLTPIPHSYPGASILSDDLGKIVGEDDCACDRKGKYFRFVSRHEDAELKGCGDTLAE